MAHTLLNLLAVLAVFIAAYYGRGHKDLHLKHTFPGSRFHIQEKFFLIHPEGKPRPVLTAKLGLGYNLSGQMTNCVPKNHLSACVVWDRVVKLNITYTEESGAQCYDIAWTGLSRDFVPMDCFNIGEDHWYGGAELHRDRWTIEKEPITMQPYLSDDIVAEKDKHGSVLERYWLSSAGVAIAVDDAVPLHVGINSTQLCFKADYSHQKGYLGYSNPKNKIPNLHYQICTKENVKKTHLYMANKLWRKPTGVPDELMFRQPIWSTWAQYKVNITQEKVLQFAREIKQYGFGASQIEIDDMYTTTYGDFTFDPDKFPNPKDMSRKIHNELGFRLTSWVTPFANLDSVAFKEGLEKNFWIRDETGKVPALIKWWQGIGTILDFTNPEAVKWYFARLKKLQELGIDSFKFDAGEIIYLPPHGLTHQYLENPNTYSTVYAEQVYKNIDRLIEVRVGYKAQHLPIFVRMMDKLSEWGYNLGIKTMIPTALHFGLLGYPFVLPDMIGGNAYNEDSFSSVGTIPSKELFIRWMQLTAFFPAMQFSIAPWQYDAETVEITRHFLLLREHYILPRILNLAQESPHTGYPIIRPVWWIASYDSAALGIDSEFLVGEDLLVAPILDEGVTSRDIYIPRGLWLDKLKGTMLKGPTLLRDYAIQLHEIGYFERQQQ